MRVRPVLGTAAVTLWGFALTLAVDRRWLAWLPAWMIILMGVVPIIIWAWLGLTHDTVRKFALRTSRTMGLLIFIATGSAIGAGLGALVYVAISRVAAKTSPLAFSVAVKGALMTPARTKFPIVWLIHSAPGKQQISPVHFLLFLQFTNLESRPVMIDEYSVYRLINGMPTPLPSIQVLGGTVVNVQTPDFKVCLELDFTGQTFDSLIQNKQIAPHETVQGWIFVEALEEEIWGPIQVRVRDTTGAQSYQTLRSEPRVSTALRAQDGSLAVTGKRIDCSSMPRVFWSDGKPVTIAEPQPTGDDNPPSASPSPSATASSSPRS
jgi:hypothetical protein